MKLYKLKQSTLVEFDGNHYRLDVDDWDDFINDDRIIQTLKDRIKNETPAGDWQKLLADGIDAPMQGQELWASGVTYERSRQGRQEESEKTGGADFYARVYEAERPELFFKATRHRVVGYGGNVRIRRDASMPSKSGRPTSMVTISRLCARTASTPATTTTTSSTTTATTTNSSPTATSASTDAPSWKRAALRPVVPRPRYGS